MLFVSVESKMVTKHHIQSLVSKNINQKEKLHENIENFQLHSNRFFEKKEMFLNVTLRKTDAVARDFVTLKERLTFD